MKLEKLDHFGIEVRDLARAERFYAEVLGLALVTRFGDQILLDCGGQNLALFEVPRPPLTPAERAQVIGIMHFGSIARIFSRRGAGSMMRA
jgi:catechol 2,3-dioxygenase-like lactoylglutathione lyase family enzyme